MASASVSSTQQVCVFFWAIPGLTKTPQSHPWQVLNSLGPRDDHGCLLHPLAEMYPGGQVIVYPLIAIENGPFIVDLPIKNGDLPIKNGDLPMKNGDFP